MHGNDIFKNSLPAVDNQVFFSANKCTMKIKFLISSLFYSDLF